MGEAEASGASSENYSPTNEAAGADASHLDEIVVPGEDDQSAGGGAGQGGDTPDAAGYPGCMPRQEFRDLFCGTFDIGGAFTGLKSLPIAADEKARAEAAADAVYDTAWEVPALRFLIQPDNVWMQRGFVILAFTGPKALAVRRELALRQQRGGADAEG